MSNCCDPWAVACQAPLSMGFPRQEYRSGLPFLSPGDLPDPGIEPGFPALQADSLVTERYAYKSLHFQKLCSLCIACIYKNDKVLIYLLWMEAI